MLLYWLCQHSSVNGGITCDLPCGGNIWHPDNSSELSRLSWRQLTDHLVHLAFRTDQARFLFRPVWDASIDDRLYHDDKVPFKQRQQSCSEIVLSFSVLIPNILWREKQNSHRSDGHVHWILPPTAIGTFLNEGEASSLIKHIILCVLPSHVETIWAFLFPTSTHTPWIWCYHGNRLRAPTVQNIVLPPHLFLSITEVLHVAVISIF